MTFRRKLDLVLVESKVDALRKTLFNKVKALVGAELPPGVELRPCDGDRTEAGFFAQLCRRWMDPVGIAYHDGKVFVGGNLGGHRLGARPPRELVFTKWNALRQALLEVANHLANGPFGNDRGLADEQEWLQSYLDEIWTQVQVGDYPLTAREQHVDVDGVEMVRQYLILAPPELAGDWHWLVSLTLHEWAQPAQQPLTIEGGSGVCNTHFSASAFRELLRSLAEHPTVPNDTRLFRELVIAAVPRDRHMSRIVCNIWRAMRAVLAKVDVSNDPEPWKDFDASAERFKKVAIGLCRDPTYTRSVSCARWQDDILRAHGYLTSDYGQVAVEVRHFPGVPSQIEAVWSFVMPDGKDASGRFWLDKSEQTAGAVRELVLRGLDEYFVGS